MKKGFNLKRLLSVVLSLCLILSTGVCGTTYSVAAAADEPQDFVVEHDHDGWTVLNEDVVGSQYIASGNYYLENNVKLTKTIYYIEGEVTICLNGHTLYTDSSTISIGSDATLTLTDCTDEGVITGDTKHLYVNGGTLILESGTITGYKNTQGGAVYITDGTFIMKGGSISDNNVGYIANVLGGAVYVNKGTFIMEGGMISGNEAVTGAGVYVGSGDFIMRGGSISGNSASSSNSTWGGGVYVAAGTLTMEGGTISDNNATYGGGICVTAGTFAMQGGEISGNTASTSGGGVYVNRDTAVFTMENGTISGNKASTYGGGVHVETGVFTMKNGTISANMASARGGGVYVETGVFTMKNGTISANTASIYGGGVCVSGTNATFIMENGMISNNISNSCGGGVHIISGSFTMENGTISGNYASDGGGVLVTSEFIMKGGTISGNTANRGGGVFIYGKFNILGTPVVAGNTLSEAETESNILLNSYLGVMADIHVIGELTNGAMLGVSRRQDVKETPVLTQGYSDYHTDNAGKYFFYDNAEIFGNCDVGTGPDGEAWFGYNVTFKDTSGQTLEEQFVGYNCTATPLDDNYWSTEISGAEFDFDTPITENLTLYSAFDSILNPMSSQIRFKRNADGSYANMFDVRSRAKISDEDFAKHIAETNEEAITKISKLGFVYAPNSTDFSIEDAQKVAKGETISGYADAPVKYIQDADGYYMFTCIITDIPVEDIEQGVTAYAYICVEDKWYFYNAETTMNFKDLYDANYYQAAKAYGW